jgi:hypothetical protein
VQGVRLIRSMRSRRGASAGVDHGDFYYYYTEHARTRDGYEDL